MSVKLPIGIVFGVASVFFNALARVLWKRYPDEPESGCNSWAIFGYVLRAGSGLAGNVATVMLPITLWNMFPILGIVFAQILSKMLLRAEITFKQYALGAGICGAMAGAIFCANFPNMSGDDLIRRLQTPQRYISLTIQTLIVIGLTLYIHNANPTGQYYKYVAPVLLAWEMVLCDVTITIIGNLLFADGSVLQHVIVVLVLILWIATAIFYLSVEQNIMKTTIVVQTELIRVMFRVLLTSMNAIILFNSSLNHPIAYVICMVLVTVFMVLYISDAQPTNDERFEMLDRMSDEGDSLPPTNIDDKAEQINLQDLEPTD